METQASEMNEDTFEWHIKHNVVLGDIPSESSLGAALIILCTLWLSVSDTASLMMRSVKSSHVHFILSVTFPSITRFI